MILKTSVQIRISTPTIINGGIAHVNPTCFHLERQKQY